MESFMTFLSSNYSALTIIVSSLVASLIQSFVENSAVLKANVAKNEAAKDSEKEEGSERTKKLEESPKPSETKGETKDRLFSYISIYILVYIAICFLTVLAYAVIRVGWDFHALWRFISNFFVYYFKRQAIEFFAVPLVTELLTRLIRRSAKNGLNWLILGIAVILAVAIVAAPTFLKVGTNNTLPLETEIMTELRTMPFPYDGRIYDIDSFKRAMDNGYWIDGKPAGTTPSNSKTEEYDRSFIDKDIDLMTLRELIQCVEYFHDHNQDNSMADVIQQYLGKAYQLYLNMGDAINDWNVIGRMFYYMGYHEDPSCFQYAVDAFLKDNEFDNAGISYREWYNKEHVFEYARKGLECFLNQVIAEYSSEDKRLTASSISNFKWLFNKTYVGGTTPFMDLLHELCQYHDDAFLNTLDLSWTVATYTQTAADAGTIINRTNRYLAQDRYQYCPKLLILQQSGVFLNGGTVSCAGIYDLYKSHPEFFEKEDRINLVWLLYESGEYIKTYEAAKDGDTIIGYEDITSDAEYAMLLLKAESFLQNTEALSETDELQLYKDITSALDELGVLSAESDPQDSVGDQEVIKPITDPIAARLRLVQCILAGRIGIDASYTGLSEICEELFNTDSRTGLYIVAALSNQDKNYSRTISLCNQILEMIQEPDYFYNRVLFLKSDALIGLAGTPEGEEKRSEYYEEAEKLLDSVRKMAGNDYLNALKRLSNLYELMGRYDEQQVIDDETQRFR